jgi:glycosyltransferase involved in cell wall biosynthesis
MRICYLCSDLGIPLNGHKGASAHVRGFVRALKSSGHDVIVITSSDDGDGGLGVPVVPIPKPDLFTGLSTLMEEQPSIVRALRHVYNNVLTEQTLKDIIKRFKPELIYERYSPFAVAGTIIGSQMGIPHILEMNALLAEEGKLYRRQALQEACEFLERTALKFTSVIVTVSRELKESLITSGIPEAMVIDVPNGVDEMFFKQEDTSLFNDFKDKIVIGFVGSLKPWHGIDFLCNVFRVLAQDPVYHLLVVGNGPMMKTLKSLKKEFPDRVTLTGGIDHKDVISHIDVMDIAVCPYPKLDKFYFSPLKLLEYMARGKTIIATEIGQVSKFIRHGQTGWLVSPGDIQGFVDAILTLSEDNESRKKMGRKAADEARAFHSWKHRTSLILEYYQRRNLAKKPQQHNQRSARNIVNNNKRNKFIANLKI